MESLFNKYTGYTVLQKKYTVRLDLIVGNFFFSFFILLCKIKLTNNAFLFHDLSPLPGCPNNNKNKPGAKATDINSSQCNFTNRQNPQI